MSVMECDRIGCDNVMCDRMSHEYGYICNDCFTELISTGLCTNIEAFMNSSRSSCNEVGAEFVYSRYNAVFSGVY